MLFIYSFYGDLHSDLWKSDPYFRPSACLDQYLSSFSCFIGCLLLEKLHDVTFIHQSLPACKGGKAYYFGQSQYRMNSKY